MLTTLPAATILPAPALPATLTLPLTSTVPPGPPPSTIDPLCPDTERACNEPDTLTASRTACFTVAALRSMVPPFARILPETSTSAWPFGATALVGTATCRKPSPYRSSVACSPEPSATFPSGTLMVPAFDTEPPNSATKPPGAVEIVPWFDTAAEAPLPRKFRLPALKLLSAMPSVEATKPPPTFTLPDGVMAMPLGLTR
jgi:hypothetical protein